MMHIRKDLLELLQSRINYHFRNLDLLVEALSHPSLKQLSNVESHKDYERLEFLGDSILNFIITEILFQHFPSYDEGKMAKTKALLVCKDTLYNIGVNLDIGDVIIMTNGEEISGGRENKNNIENAIEALIAAIYLDGGINVVKKFIGSLWESLLSEDNIKLADPKSALQEWSQSKSMSIPLYEVVSRSGESHSPTFVVRVVIEDLDPEYGEGKSIKEAQKAAAMKFLSRISDEN